MSLETRIVLIIVFEKFDMRIGLTLFIIFFSLTVLSQDQSEILDEHFQHHHLALMVGVESSKSYTNTTNTAERLNVPTLGLNYTYWLDDGLGFGIKSILGLADYQVKSSDTSLIDRSYPLSASAQMIFNPAIGLLFFIGPGIEIEKHKSFFIFDMGLGYRLKIWKQFDIKPEVYYCFKQASVGSYGINLNLGWRFGK